MTFNDLINKYLKRDVKKIEANTNKKEKEKENQKEPKTNKLAKDRLHVLLVQDRASVSAEFIDLMKEEVVEVVKKYVTVDDEGIDLNMKSEIKENGKTEAGLVIRIPILNIRNEMKSQKVKEDELEAIDKRFDEKKESALKTQETIQKIEEENTKDEEISKQEFEEIKENMFKEDEKKEVKNKLEEVEKIEKELDEQGLDLLKIQEDLVRRINERENTNKTFEELKDEILSGKYDYLENEEECKDTEDEEKESEILKKIEEDLDNKADKLEKIKEEIAENIEKGSKNIENALKNAKEEIEIKKLEEKNKKEKELEKEKIKREQEIQRIKELKEKREEKERKSKEDLKLNEEGMENSIEDVNLKFIEENEKDNGNENRKNKEEVLEIDNELEDNEYEDSLGKSLDIYTKEEKTKHSKSLLSDDKTMIFDPEKVNELLEKQTDKRRKNKRR